MCVSASPRPHQLELHYPSFHSLQVCGRIRCIAETMPLKRDLLDSRSWYERNEHGCALPVAYVILTKEFDKESLLLDDSSSKEFPEYQSISQEADVVPKHELRSQAPPEEAEVRRVPRNAVYSALDQDVVVPLL
jgi:hypothetical protein